MTKSLLLVRQILRWTALLLLTAPRPLPGQTVIPSRMESTPGSVDVLFTPTPGKICRIEHTADLRNWAAYPETVYGLGQQVRYHVYDAPVPQASAPVVSTTPRPSAHYFFMVCAFADKSAVVSWAGQDGSRQMAYVTSFDLVYQNKVMQEMVNGTLVPASPAQPYYMDVWSWSGVKDPAVVNLAASPAEAATLAKLTSQFSWVRSEMTARVDWRATHPSPPPQPPKLFDDRGKPLRQWFRVREYETDSNFDLIPDHQQLGATGQAYNMDLDNDGIPNGYDRDLWPASRDAATYALLDHVLINEVLAGNDFSNADEDGASSDWIELYNPTSATVDVSNWFLSDSEKNMTKWQIPEGVTLASGKFLVIWASDKNRSNPANPLHTNYSLSPSPEPIYLSRTVGSKLVTVDSLQPANSNYPNPTANYGTQRTDVSFGRYASGSGLQTGYFILPTPGSRTAPGKFTGAHNVVGALGFTDPPTFSGSVPGIYENTTVSAVLTAPATGGAVFFTTNNANPTRYSELYSGPIKASRSTIIRAVAAKEGYLPSASVTRSFLFKESILGTAPQGTTPTDQQGARDAQGQFKGLLYGYPEKTEDSAYPMRYGLNASVIAAKKDTIRAELGSVPIVSLVSSVPGIFEKLSGGLYPNSGKTEGGGGDPTGRDWERACSFEIMEPGSTAFKQANAALLITGGSSIFQSTTTKHNLRIKFDATYGPDFLDYPLFSGGSNQKFYNFNLKNTTHDSWSNTWDDDGEIRDPATYCNEAFIAATHKAMGHEVPNQRWCHLFINGIYWGPYEITERVDDQFMKAHFDGTKNYTVIKQDEEAVSGNYGDWTALKTLTASFPGTPAVQKAALYSQITGEVDMDNYIDYLIVNAYGQPGDWPSNNYRAAKMLNTPGAKWKFIVWDAEWTLRQGEQSRSPVGTLGDSTGITFLHAAFQSHQPYRDAFSARLNRAFKTIAGDTGSGTLIEATAKARFQAAMGRFDDVIFSESARWGDMDTKKTGGAYTKSDPNYLPGNPNKGDWDRSTSYILNTWIPQRKTPFLDAMQTAGFYVPIP